VGTLPIFADLKRHQNNFSEMPAALHLFIGFDTLAQRHDLMDDRLDLASPQHFEHLPEILVRAHGTADQADLPTENIADVNVDDRIKKL